MEMVGWPVGGGVEVVGFFGEGGAEVLVACGGRDRQKGISYMSSERLP